MAKRIVYCTSPFIFALSFFTTLRKRLRDDEPGGSNPYNYTKKDSTLVVESLGLWALTDSNRRPSACKADALNQLS